MAAFPCNQFGGQEPKPAAQVCDWAAERFGATFPILGKVDVNGAGACPLWTYLKEEKKGIFGTRSVKWNFTKFLVDRAGVPVARYSSTTTPAAIEKDVVRLLGGAKPTGKSFVRMDDI